MELFGGSLSKADGAVVVFFFFMPFLQWIRPVPLFLFFGGCGMLKKVVKSKPITEFPMNQSDVQWAASAWHKLQIVVSHGVWSGLWQEKWKVKGEAGDIDGGGWWRPRAIVTFCPWCKAHSDKLTQGCSAWRVLQSDVQCAEIGWVQADSLWHYYHCCCWLWFVKVEWMAFCWGCAKSSKFEIQMFEFVRW